MPREGTETFLFLLQDNTNHPFGDKMPREGTETFKTCQFVKLLYCEFGDKMPREGTETGIEPAVHHVASYLEIRCPERGRKP